MATESQNGEQSRHQEMGHKSLLQSDALYEVTHRLPSLLISISLTDPR